MGADADSAFRDASEATPKLEVSCILGQLSAAAWADLSLCTEDDPCKGAAPSGTIQLCSLAADALDAVSCSRSGAVHAAKHCIAQEFGSEAALACRLCTLLHAEVLGLTRRDSSTAAGSIVATTRLLKSLSKLFRCRCSSNDDEPTTQVPSATLAASSAWRLVGVLLQECQLQGLFWSLYAAQERWEDLSRQLDPLDEAVRSIGFSSWLEQASEPWWMEKPERSGVPLFNTIVEKYGDLTDSLETCSSSSALRAEQTPVKGKSDELMTVKIAMLARKRAVARKIWEELPNGQDYILALADKLDALMHSAAACNAGARLVPEPTCEIKQFIRLLCGFAQVANLSPIAKQLAKHLVSCLVRACYVRSSVRANLSAILDLAMHPELIRDSCQELISLIREAYSYSSTEEEGLSWSVFFASGNLAHELETAMRSSNNLAGSSDSEKASLLQNMEEIRTAARARMCALGKPGGFIPFSDYILNDGDSELSEELFSATPSEFGSSDEGEDLNDFIDDTPEFNNQGFLQSILDVSAERAADDDKDGRICAMPPTAKQWLHSRVAFLELEDVAQQLLARKPPPDIPESKFATKPKPKRPRLF